MVHICESYGRGYDVKINTQKTHLGVCDYLNKYSNMSSLTLNGETIAGQRIASHLDPHLGHILWGLIIIILLLDMRSMTLHGEHIICCQICVM